MLRNEEKEEELQQNFQYPPVSILISAFNEEKVIRQKLESILSLEYPKDRLEVLIGSDYSDDKTVEIVKEFTSKYDFIRLIEYSERRGKPSVVNDLVIASSHSLLVLTDANVFFEKKMLQYLVRHFNDEKIGLAGANILNKGMKKEGISVQEKSYIERENLIKYREGVLWGCMMGPFGGCYALRKNLFEKIPQGYLVDDFYISMRVLEKKYSCIIDLKSICYEDVSNEMQQEFKRKARISAGNFQNLKSFGHFLLKPFSPAGFCFISHKFLRWITPFFIILSVISLIILSYYKTFFFILLIGEIVLLCSPVIDWIAVRLGLHLRFLRFVSYFSIMNIALLKGFFHFIKGIDSGIWTPTKRG